MLPLLLLSFCRVLCFSCHGKSIHARGWERSLLHMPKGIPLFMPWEVHSCQRLIKSTPHSRRFIYDLLSSRVAYGAKEQWLPFYRYDYDLDSLWWILLWACLFCVSSNRRDLTHDLGYRIFTYTSQPSPDRTYVIQTLYNVDIKQSVPSQLERLVAFIHALHAWLHYSYVSDMVYTRGESP